METVLLAALLIIAAIWTLGLLGKSIQENLIMLIDGTGYRKTHEEIEADEETISAEERHARIEQLICELERVSDFSDYSGTEQLLQALGMMPSYISDDSFDDIAHKCSGFRRIAAYEDLLFLEIHQPFDAGKLSFDEFKNYSKLLCDSFRNLPNASESYNNYYQQMLDIYNSTTKSAGNRSREIRDLQKQLLDQEPVDFGLSEEEYHTLSMIAEAFLGGILALESKLYEQDNP